MKDTIIIGLLILSLAGNAFLWFQTRGTGAGEHPELAESMALLQRYTHKLSLAVTARNAELARFYQHELEEVSEEIGEEIPVYEGHEVAKLMSSMLDPQIEAMEQAVAAGDWPRCGELVGTLTQACNSCHQATEHAFIHIAAAPANPFNQKF